MRSSRFILSVVLALFLSLTLGELAMAMEIKSSAFKNGQDIPARCAFDQMNLSPDLAWAQAPAQTKSFVLIMDDPDAPAGTWVHWVIYDIPATAKGLAAGIPKMPTLPDGAKQGLSSFHAIGYGGPCPPPGPKHRYFFKLYALDTMLDLPPGKTKADIETASNGHILEKAELMGLYGR